MAQKFYNGNYVFQYEKYLGGGESVTETIIANPKKNAAILALVIEDDGYTVNVNVLPRSEPAPLPLRKLFNGESAHLSSDGEGLNGLEWVKDGLERKRFTADHAIDKSTVVHITSIDPLFPEQISQLCMTGNESLDQDITTAIHAIAKFQGTNDKLFALEGNLARFASIQAEREDRSRT